MCRRLNQHARVIASASAAAMLLVVFATCAAAARMTPEQRACCAAMEHDCGEMTIESSCCTGAAQPVASPASAVKPGVLAVAAPQLIAVLSPGMPHHAVVAATWPPEASSASPPGIPTYLFVSSFRI